MIWIRPAAALAAVLLLALPSTSTADDGPKKTLLCPVDGQPAQESFVAEHRGAKVFFCSEHCAEEFAKGPAAFSIKANLQLALSGQARQ